MKKLTPLGSIAILLAMMVATVGAQVTLTENWQIAAGSVAWFANDHNTRDLAYNPSTDHVLVVSRTGGVNIQILDALNGNNLGTMDITGISGGAGADLSHIEVADDGAIYATNLVAWGTATTPFRIYRWASEGAVPTAAYAVSGEINARTGDSLAVAGSGASTVIYASGSTSDYVEVFTTADGLTYTAGTDINVGTSRARLGLDVLPSGNIVGNNVSFASDGQVGEWTTAGVLVGEIPSSEVNTSMGGLGASQFGSGIYLALQGGTDNIGGAVVEITTGLPSTTVLAVAPSTINPNDPLAPNTNTNGTGAAVFDTLRQALLLCNTNNSIGSYGATVPAELSVFSGH